MAPSLLTFSFASHGPQNSPRNSTTSMRPSSVFSCLCSLKSQGVGCGFSSELKLNGVSRLSYLGLNFFYRWSYAHIPQSGVSAAPPLTTFFLESSIGNWMKTERFDDFDSVSFFFCIWLLPIPMEESTQHELEVSPFGASTCNYM